MLMTSALLAGQLLATSVGAAAGSPSQDTLWAGHHVTRGSKRVPFRGEIGTRTDAYVLASIRTHSDGGMEIIQKTCRVAVAPVAGIRIRMDGSSLPSSRLRLTEDSNGILRGRGVVRWDAEDVDRDDNPGLTVSINARVCSGKLYVANHSATEAEAWMSEGTLRGRARVRVRQSILGAKGACLSVVASDTDERQTGTFAFSPVAASATCESLSENAWPVEAS